MILRLATTILCSLIAPVLPAQDHNAVQNSGPADPINVITGSWFNPETAGEGFMVHAVREHVIKPFQVQEGLAIGYFYGFDPEGERFWLIGTHQGPMDWGEEINFDAVSVSGGSFEDYDPANTEEFEWGTFTFQPSTCTDGTITLEGQFPGESITRSRQSQVRSLARVAGSFCAGEGPISESDGVTASWWDSSKPGQGFAVHKIGFQNGIVYFYGFDSSGRPLWLIGVWDQPLVYGTQLSISMKQVSGGTFQAEEPFAPEEADWGTLELEFESCKTAQARLSGLDGIQAFDLEQLAGTFGLDCE